MSQVPVFVYILPVLLLVFYFVYSRGVKKMLASGEQQHASFRAGQIAERLGLTVVEGDPMTNFAYAGSLETRSDGTMPEVRVRLEGSPTGRHGEIAYYQKKEVDEGFLDTTYTTFYEGRVTVAVATPFTQFEIVLRKPASWVGEPKLEVGAPLQMFGDAVLDQQFILRATDPRLGPAIARAMHLLTAQQFVHVIGDGRSITFRYTPQTLTMLCVADQIYVALDQMAVLLEPARHLRVVAA